MRKSYQHSRVVRGMLEIESQLQLREPSGVSFHHAALLLHTYSLALLHLTCFERYDISK